MDLLLATVIVLLVTTAAVVQFVLLILKTDGEAGFSHHVVVTPAFVVYPIAGATFLVLAVREFYVGRRPLHAYTFAALVVLAVGRLWTVVLLARKFDLVQNVRHWQALLPVTVAMVLAGVLFCVGVVLQYAQWRRQRRKQPTQTSSRLRRKV